MVVVGHDLLHHLLGHRNWAFHDLWLGVSTVASSIFVRRMAISSTSFMPAHNSCFLALIYKDFKHVSGFLNALTTARLLLQPSNFSSRCSSKFARLSFTSRFRPHSRPGSWRPCALRYHAGLHRPVTVGLVRLSRHGCLWSHCSEQHTASLASQARVLWVLTGTHPCYTSTPKQGGGGTREPALTHVVALGGVVVHVVCCLLPVVLW